MSDCLNAREVFEDNGLGWAGAARRSVGGRTGCGRGWRLGLHLPILMRERLPYEVVSGEP